MSFGFNERESRWVLDYIMLKMRNYKNEFKYENLSVWVAWWILLSLSPWFIFYKIYEFDWNKIWLQR
jgi:hypothetical protein